MSIDVVGISNANSGGIIYPYLGKYDSTLTVLFYSTNCGIVVQTSVPAWILGENNSWWEESRFTPVRGCIEFGVDKDD